MMNVKSGSAQNSHHHILPSKVCWSSNTWLMSLVFSSTSAWFSRSPEQRNISSVKKASQDESKTLLSCNVSPSSELMLKYSSSLLECRAAVWSHAAKEKKERDRLSVHLRRSTTQDVFGAL